MPPRLLEYRLLAFSSGFLPRSDKPGTTWERSWPHPDLRSEHCLLLDSCAASAPFDPSVEDYDQWRHLARGEQPVSAGCGRHRVGCEDADVEVLSSRILVRPTNLSRSRQFYRDVLGLAVYREFGAPGNPGVVFFLGAGFLEVSGHSDRPAGHSVMIWIQVRDINAEFMRLVTAGVRVLREPISEPWGLTEMWIADPDGIRIVLVEVPADHPLRLDQRSSPSVE